MSCPNPDCNQDCNCNNCCPPVSPPPPPTPPTCEGTECVEVYDAACINYTGPDIECLGINTNANLNDVIQAFATALCNCI